MKKNEHGTFSPLIVVVIAAIFSIILAIIACDTNGSIGGSSDTGDGDADSGNTSGSDTDGGDTGGSASRNVFICYDETGNEYALTFLGNGARTLVSGAKNGDKYEITVSKNGSRIGSNTGKIDNIKEEKILTLLPDGASGFTVEINENREIVRFPKAIPLGNGTIHAVNGSLSQKGGTVTLYEETVIGSDLAEKLTWLKNNAQSNTKYTIYVDKNETLQINSLLPGEVDTDAINYLEYPGKSNITVLLKGPYTVNLSSYGCLFYIGIGVALELEDITLQGKGYNDNGVVSVYEGSLTMQGNTKITGNNYQRGINISFGVFTMNGGEITGNGGGIRVDCGIITMNDGKIYNNNDSSYGGYGGGVYVAQGSFTMNGGEISGNKAATGGGGVYVVDFLSTYKIYSTFIMNGGKIFGNTVTDSSGTGGGVSLFQYAVFHMNGGEISGNTASYCGGVSVQFGSNFRITNGTIYGLNESNATLQNTATADYSIGSALSCVTGDYGATAQYGTFIGNNWNKSGDLDSTNNTIKVINGVLQP